MSDELRRLREVCEAATPGPWDVEDASDEVGHHRARVIDSAADHVADPRVACGLLDADGDAIALLGSVWPEMLAVVDAARAVVETAKPDPETWPARRKLCDTFCDLDAAIRRSLDGAR